MGSNRYKRDKYSRCKVINTPTAITDQFRIMTDSLSQEYVANLALSFARRINAGEHIILTKDDLIQLGIDATEFALMDKYEKEIIIQTLARIRDKVAFIIKGATDAMVYNQKQTDLELTYSLAKIGSWTTVSGGQDLRIKRRVLDRNKLGRTEKLPYNFDKHPNIAAEYRYVSEKGDLACVKKYEDNLKSADELFVIDLETRVKILLDAVKGLIYIHRNGYVHCDIKPENIYVVKDNENGEIIGQIGDLEGLILSGSEIELHHIFATPDYREPLKTESKTIDFAFDIYSFALIVVEILNKEVSGLRDNFETTSTIADFPVDVGVELHTRCQNLADKLELLCFKVKFGKREERPKLFEFRAVLDEIYAELCNQ
jgi:serine/threonine protein kinase